MSFNPQQIHRFIGLQEINDPPATAVEAFAGATAVHRTENIFEDRRASFGGKGDVALNGHREVGGFGSSCLLTPHPRYLQRLKIFCAPST